MSTNSTGSGTGTGTGWFWLLEYFITKLVLSTTVLSTLGNNQNFNHSHILALPTPLLLGLNSMVLDVNWVGQRQTERDRETLSIYVTKRKFG